MPTGDIPLEAKSDLAKWGVFDENMAWGGDICAPSVSKCEVKVGDYVMRVGDHGDFWTSKFSLKKQTKTSVILVGETKEFYLEVKFTLKNKELIRDYKVTNKIKFKLPFTFADHLLLPVTNVTLERNSGKMRVEWSYQNKLGQKGDMISWPVKRQKPFADKLFMKLKKDKKGNFSIFCLCHCEPEFIEGEAIPSDLRLPRRYAPRNDNIKYDLIFVDMYSGDKIASFIDSDEFLKSLKKLVAEGSVVFNRLNFSKHKSENYDFLNKLNLLFSGIRTKKSYSNLIVYCTK